MLKLTIASLAAGLVGLATATWHATPALAGPTVASDSAPLGVFMDHRGDGAVELSSCGDRLCGTVVWVREGAPAGACGTAVIGDAVLVGDGVWDRGWILDPENGEKFDVEITRLPGDQLQVMGYLGSKDLSETFVWTLAPSDLARCQPARLQSGDAETTPATESQIDNSHDSVALRASR